MVTENDLLYYANKIVDVCDRPNMRIFNGFFPIIPELYDDEYGFFMDATPESLDAPINISMFYPGFPDGWKAEKEWQFHRLRKVNPKELRKKAGVFCLNPVLFETTNKAVPKIQNAVLQWGGNGKFSIVDPNNEINSLMRSEIVSTAQAMLGVQFNLENQCYVYIKPDDAVMGFKFPLDDLGQVKELFAMRDIPDGYKRRVALKHWVQTHLRRKPSKPDEIVEIKKYLRGKEVFRWNGMSGAIYVNT